MLTRQTGSARSADDAGISLVEVMVAMVVTAIVGSMMVLYLISSVNSARRADGQNEQAAGARLVLDSWSTLVPLAVDINGQSAAGSVRFYSIAPTSVKFCVAMKNKGSVAGPVDGAPIGVEVALVGGQLVENRWKTCAGMKLNGIHAKRILALHAARVSSTAWLMTPLARTDMPNGATVVTALVTSTIITGTSQTPLNSAVTADATKIANITGMQLAFKTTAAPGRPAPSATYTSLLALAGGY
jgi:type II secretory pathway pseudopilin PulG